MRKHIAYYTKNLKDASSFRVKVNKIDNKKELIETSGDVKWLISNRDGGGLKMVQQDTETVIDLYVDGIEYNYEIDNE